MINWVSAPLVAVVGFSWSSVIAGGAIAIFAFVLATARDELKAFRGRQRRDQAIMRAVMLEVSTLAMIVENNQELTKKDLELLKQGQRLVNPIDPVATGVWELVKIAPPRRLTQPNGLLSEILDVSRRAAQVNEIIRSRESFRVGNQALGSFIAQMQEYDQLLLTFQGELLDALHSLEASLADL